MLRKIIPAEEKSISEVDIIVHSNLISKSGKILFIS